MATGELEVPLLERAGMHCDGCGRTWFSRVASLLIGSPLARCALCGGTLQAVPGTDAGPADEGE